MADYLTFPSLMTQPSLEFVQGSGLAIGTAYPQYPDRYTYVVAYPSPVVARVCAYRGGQGFFTVFAVAVPHGSPAPNIAWWREPLTHIETWPSVIRYSEGDPWDIWIDQYASFPTVIPEMPIYSSLDECREVLASGEWDKIDPYSPGGTSGPAMGDGTFDFSSEPVDFQAAPTIGAYDTGMVSMYVPSAADLRSLAAYLWSGPFDPQNFRKLVADPMDAIIGLSILPLTAAEIGALSAELVVGNISTGLTMPLATRQYVVVDCGTVNVLPKWGAYLDFSPYSKLQLFLPYIGYVDISPDDCMNGTISVRYTVDLLSGTCVVQVKCQDHVLYEFAGTCSCSCPVTAGQYQNIVTSALKLGGALMSSVTSLGGALGALDDVANTAVSAAKPAISRSGGFGGSSGLMGHQVPYLILTVPRMCTPGDQDQLIGYPSYVTKTLGDLSGYVQVDTIHLAGIPASKAEQDEIVSLLQEGVYL